MILIFDEIYLQKCEEYVGGETFGSDEGGNLYKGMMTFMIVGIGKNIPHVLHVAPENRIDASWLMEEIIRCIHCLQSKGFNVRECVCDNHPSNVSAYRKLISTYSESNDDLCIYINDKRIYLFYDSVHIIKNIRNNLLNRKRFIFPPFSCDALKDKPIIMEGGEITWALLHNVYEKDHQCQASLRAAPKITASVLHPGNCKQSVPLALAVFEPSTIAAIRNYFPNKEDSAGFLNLIYTWWTISNSKVRFNSRDKLGDAAVKNDGKPEFLRNFADWVENWQNQKIRNAEKFTLSAQTSDALCRTLRCQAALIEDLLSEEQEFILTARFQSDPIERRFGQYRQMSGGRFLISAKDVSTSENIIRIKTLIKQGCEIDSSVKISNNYDEMTEKLKIDVEAELGQVESIKLNEESRKISDYVAGYIAFKTESFYENCCASNLLDEQPNSAYIGLLSRGGLKNPSMSLKNAVSDAFAILDASSAAIRRCKIPSRIAGVTVLQHYLDVSSILCEEHTAHFSIRLMRIICNCFFNNQRKRTNDTVTKDNVAEFKQNQRRKTLR